MSSEQPGTYFLNEDSCLISTDRNKEKIIEIWKKTHKLRPNLFHEISYKPDVPIALMPKVWDIYQLKPGDDLKGVPCCRATILEIQSDGSWKCSECGKKWVEDRRNEL